MNHRFSAHHEPHYSNRNGWLRASVLGANDGLISTAGLMMGLAAANPGTGTLLLTGAAALVGGAVSMAAGEYVSVSSQADTEKADLAAEQRELQRNPSAELAELAAIYEKRGLDAALAQEVARQLSRHNALDAHARDEIGITETASARPFQAAAASAAAFAVGALPPVLTAVLAPPHQLVVLLACITLAGLALLGAAAAKLGGAPLLPAVLRVVLWGVAAMGITGLIGRFFGTAV